MQIIRNMNILLLLFFSLTAFAFAGFNKRNYVIISCGSLDSLPKEDVKKFDKFQPRLFRKTINQNIDVLRRSLSGVSCIVKYTEKTSKPSELGLLQVFSHEGILTRINVTNCSTWNSTEACK